MPVSVWVNIQGKVVVFEIHAYTDRMQLKAIKDRNVVQAMKSTVLNQLRPTVLEGVHIEGGFRMMPEIEHGRSNRQVRIMRMR